jgi:hypothetical protein
MPLNKDQKFEILTVVTMTTAVFGKMISCSLIKQTNASEENVVSFFRIEFSLLVVCDRLCGLVVRVSGYRYRGLGFDPRRYQIF